MKTVAAWGAADAKAPIAPMTIDRREVGAGDVEIDVLFCGVCHSDLHQVRDEWGGSLFPMVPGHEILGRVSKVGGAVKNFKVGDLAGVGCLVDSCRKCPQCNKDFEQFCESGPAYTYNSTEMDRTTRTYGGYSRSVVVAEPFCLKMPSSIDPARAAPLLCAGITTYSPLHQYGVTKGTKLGVMGLGGLGHMAVKFGVALGAEVTVLSTSKVKEADAKKLGAHNFALTTGDGAMKKLANRFDVIIDTVAGQHDYNAMLMALVPFGVAVLLGAPPAPTPLSAMPLILGNRRLAGSAIGGIKETQEMLNLCAAKNIACDVEVIPIEKINEAYERMLKNDVRYRFVIDIATLKS